jgi:hypothetical protein
VNARLALTALLLLGFQGASLFAQNLVPNGDFEIYSTLPNSSGDWAYCTGWNNVNLNSGSWPYATPDYFHTSGSGGGSLPNSAFGTVSPQSGNAIIGLYSKHSSQSNSRDYMSRPLSSPLVIGTTYTISFWMTNGSGSYYYGSSCSHMGIQLTMTPLTQVQHENTGGTPQAEVPGNPWLPNWMFYSFTYVATNAYPYVTIGNFNNDATTTTTVHASGANFAGAAYYFFDDVRIEVSSPLPIELLTFTATNKREIVETNWVTATEINNDYFTLMRSDDLQNWIEIGEVDGAGSTDEVQEYMFNDFHPLIGVSYYRLKQTDFDGMVTYSDTRSLARTADQLESLHIYPNPTNDVITVVSESQTIDRLSIFDMLGKDLSHMVESRKGEDGNSLIIDLSELPSGIYYLKTESGSKKITKI